MTGLSLDDGCHDQDLVHRVVASLDLLQILVVQTGVEVAEQSADHVLGLILQIEFVGIREQIALETVALAIGQALEEIIVKLVFRRRLLEHLAGADPVLFEQVEYLVGVLTLGNHQRDRLAVARTGHQIVDQGVIVVGQLNAVDAGIEEILLLSDLAVELEEPFVFDGSGLLQLGGHAVKRVVLGNGDLDGFVGPGQGQNIVGQLPSDLRSQQADDDDKGKIGGKDQELRNAHLFDQAGLPDAPHDGLRLRLLIFAVVVKGVAEIRLKALTVAGIRSDLVFLLRRGDQFVHGRAVFIGLQIGHARSLLSRISQARV